MPDLSTLSGRLLDNELGSEDSTVLFTTARRQAAVNDGMREFADLTECFRRDAIWTITSTAMFWNLLTDVGSTDYVRLPTERGATFWVYSSLGSTELRILSGDELPQHSVRFMDIHHPNWQSEQSAASTVYQEPSMYILTGTNLVFYPRPSTAGGSSAVFQGNVPYVAYPPTMVSSTDVPFTIGGIPRQDLRPYHQGFVHYAAAQLEKLRKNVEGVQQQTQLFLSYVQRYLTANRPRGGTAITTTRQYLRERPLRGRGASEDPRT